MKKLGGIILSAFVVCFIVSFFLIFAILNLFYEFDLISATTLLLASSVTAVLFAVAGVITVISEIKAKKKTKLGNSVSRNKAKFLLAYTLTIVFLFSIKSELLLKIEDMKEILSISWTIFGISMAIFLIWNVVIIDYLEKKKPTRPTSSIPVKTWLYIEEKGDFYSDATSLFSNITLLLVNLLGLVIATVFVYITNRSASILSQSITTLVLFLCTNSLVALFLDILRPINEKKKIMLRETTVTNEEIDLENTIITETEIALTAIDTIKNTCGISEESKNEVISGIVGTYYKKCGITLPDTTQKK